MKSNLSSKLAPNKKLSAFRVALVLVIAAASIPLILDRTVAQLPVTSSVNKNIKQPRFLLTGGDHLDKLDFIADHYDLAVWHTDPRIKERLPYLRKRNKNFKAIMYREAFCLLEEETNLKESVGFYDMISKNHPEWFQRDQNGRRVEVPDYPGRWMMDFGNPVWQKFWIEKTLQDVRSGDWDGVFADDILTTIKAHDLPPLQKYTSDKALQQAVTSFLKRAYPAFQRAGKLFIINVSGSYHHPGLWEEWLELSDGIMEEHFAGEGWTWGSYVAENQLFSTLIAAQKDKWVLNITYGFLTERDKMISSLAAHLVVAGEKGYWYYRPKAQYGPSKPEWDFSWDVDLGKPLEETDVKGKVWWRTFEKGTAVVNTGRSTEVVEFYGKQVVLEAHQGKIVMKSEASE